MLFTIFTTVWISLFMFLLWFLILLILSFILRLSYGWKVYKTLFSFLVIASLVNLSKITIPEQNQVTVLLIFSFFYLFLFYIIKKLKKWSTKTFKINNTYIYIIFSLLIFFIWKWEFLDKWSISISEKTSIWMNWEVLYKQYWWINNNLAIFNEYWTNWYDTVKYDINLDGFADLKTIDIDDDLVIDDIIVYTYNNQKIYLGLLLIIFIIITYIFSNWKHSKIVKQKNKVKIKVDLKWLKINKINKSQIKIISIILLFSIFIGIFTPTYAKRIEDMSPAEWRQTAEWKNWESILLYLKKVESCKVKKCTWLSETVTYFYENYYNTGYSNKYYDSNKIASLFDKKLIQLITYCEKKIYWCWKNNSSVDWLDKNIQELIVPEIKNKINNKNIDNVVELYDDFNEFWVIEDENIPIINSIDVNKANNDIKNIADDVFKWIKLTNNSTSLALDWLNKVTDKLKWINDWELIDTKTMVYIDWLLDDFVGNKWMKSIDWLIESGKKYWDTITKVWWKIGKLFNWLWYIWDAIQWYDDYNEITKKNWGNSDKIFAETLLTVWWKTVLWFNPRDFSLWILSWVASFSWFDVEAKVIDEFKISERYEDLLEIWSNKEWVSINRVTEDAGTDFLKMYNDPDIWVWTKSVEFLKLNTILVVWWLWAIAWEAIWTFSWWISEIKKYFTF